MTPDDPATGWDDIWRWVNVVVFAVATAVMVALWVAKWRRSLRGQKWMPFDESISLWGGALICGAIVLGTVGVLAGWSWYWRLPFLAVAGMFTVVGRGLQLWHERKH